MALVSGGRGATAGEEGGRLRAAGEVELLEDVREVVLHGLVAESQRRRDLLVGLPVGDEGQHLPLLGRELGDLVGLAARGPPLHLLEGLLGLPRVEEGLPPPPGLARPHPLPPPPLPYL